MKSLPSNATQSLIHISKISIKKLFGHYNYNFPEEGFLGELVIFYGDNGSGKTNLLKLVFQMLSTTRNKGHKKALSETPFSEFEIELSNKVLIRAKRLEGLLTGPVIFEIFQNRKSLVRWHFDASREEYNYVTDNDLDLKAISKLSIKIRDQIELSKGKELFFTELEKLKISCFILTPDRILMGGELESRPGDFLANPNRRESLSDLLSQSRVNSLELAFKTATDMIRKKMFRGAYAGGESANQIYDDVIRKILGKNVVEGVEATPSEIKATLKQKLKSIEDSYAAYGKYGLASQIRISGMLQSIEKAKGSKINLIREIIEPYLNSLQARSESLDDVYKLVDYFVDSVNVFLRDKTLHFKINSGFSIVSSLGNKELKISQLSSGEQQLLLMFCHVLSARDTSSIFIIDEPEISLNIKWQRGLVSSLLGVAKDSGIQLIFSSHSFEILSKHRESVVTLESKLSI